MKRKKFATKVLAGICIASLIVTLFPSVPQVQAASWTDESVNQYIDAGGFKTELFGTGMYNWETIPRSEKLPPSKVYLTENYMETVGTVPTSDWASSIVFDQYSESLYAHPLAYRAASNGMQMATPAVTVESYPTDNEPQVTSLLKDDTVELVVGGEGFTAADAKVDKTTDWTYDVIMANSAGTASMSITLAKGSPYAYYKFNGVTPNISLGAGATNMAIYKNGTSSHQIGISVLNKKDNSTHYYGIYAPAGTTWTNADNKLIANLPSGKNYISIAILPDNTDATFNTYAQYAYNYITDTIVEWNYNENSSTVSTNYYFETTNQETGAVGGDTIMALYPHQWRYAQDESFAPYTYETIRGQMKTIVGSNYTTNMTYNGILPVMPIPESEEGIGILKQQIGYYYGYYKETHANRQPQWIDPGLDSANGGYDTYWIGKNYNRISDVIMMADLLDDDDADMQAMKEEMASEMEANLLYWFNPEDGFQKGENDYDSYFYYHKPYGTLIGYPSGFGSDYEMNDHYFHYGYWIKAAATLALLDETGTWEQTNGGMVYELIDDIANMNRNGQSHSYEKTGTKYPFLRNFDIYEGHSWANGVSNYEYDANGNLVDAGGGLSGGNNQESSTEAVNAWAAIILWGEAVGDEEIRDLGVYLYTTEVAAIEDYYYDIHGDIFPDGYIDADNFNLQSVTRLFGGRYDHSTWWTEDPIEATTINMLPMTGATLFLGKNNEKVKAVCDSIDTNSVQWNHYLQNPGNGLDDPYMHQDILAEYYALADPEEAMNRWSIEDIEGQPKIEFGDSRAHTYGYIQSMVEYGTPNYEITGSSPFSMVFEKDGKRTYVAYNYSEEEETVYFSDGTYIEVQPGTQYTGEKTGDGENPEADDPSKVKYNTEYYVEIADGTYVLNTTKKAQADPDTIVTAEQIEISGYAFDANNALNVLSGTVTTESTVTLKLYYKRNTYNINFELNGGNVNGALPTTFKYGQEIALPTPTKSGMAFEGWYKDAQLTQLVTSTATATENLTLYAKYYDPNAVSNVALSDSAIMLLVGGKQRLTATVSPETATNKNVTWSSSETGVATVENGVITALTAGTTTITVTTAEGGYTATCQVTVKEDNNVQLDEVGVKKDLAGNVITYVSNQPSSAGIVAYGRVFDTLEEANNAALNDLPGVNMTKNSQGVWEYNFGTLDNSKYFVYAFNFAEHNIPVVIPVQDIVTAGEQITTYTVTFETGEGSTVDSQKIISGQKAFEPEDPTRAGYTFNGWKLNGENYDFTAAVTSDITLTAAWTNQSGEEEITHYTVTFNSDGGTAVASQTVEAGGTVSEPTAPTREGYTFAGWYLNGSAYDFSSAVNGSITLVAQWNEDSAADTENRSEKGAEIVGNDIIIYIKDAAAMHPYYTTLNTADESFDIGSVGDAGALTINGEYKEFTITNGATLYADKYLAYWFNTAPTPVIIKVSAIPVKGSAGDDTPTVKTYTVTFNSNGGSAVSAQTVNNGATATRPKDPTRTGFTFTGWYLNGVEYNFSTAVTGNITLVAHWEENTTEQDPTDPEQYTVTFNSNGGSAVSAQTVHNGATASEPTAPIRNGYIFVGWYLDGFPYSFSTPVSGNIELVAQWTNDSTEQDPTASIISVTFNKNEMSLQIDDEETLVVTVNATGTIDTGVIWTSSNSAIAEVDSSGKVTAKAVGEATITAISKADVTKKATCTVAVTANTGDSEKPGDDIETTVRVNGITLNKSSVTLESGQTANLVATVSPSNATDNTVKWTSDASTVATVDATGKVTALSVGKATIKATTNDGGYVATCVVTVTAKTSDNGSQDNNGNSDTNTKTFKVTFDSAQGSTVATQTVREGEKAVKPEDPTRAGYKFAGWYVGETAYNFGAAVNADVKLTAKWEVIKITKIKVTAISNKIAAGKSVQLKATLSPTDAVAKSVTWKLAKKSDSKYAKVSSKGKVTLKKKGAGKKVKVNATVTGLDGTKKTKTFTISIKKHAVKKLTIKGNKTIAVKTGRSVSLKSKVKITTTGKSVNKTLTWTTSDKTIATVSKSGKVKVNKNAKKGAKVKIKAQSTDGTNKKVTFTIKVK